MVAGSSRLAPLGRPRQRVVLLRNVEERLPIICVERQRRHPPHALSFLSVVLGCGWVLHPPKRAERRPVPVAVITPATTRVLRDLQHRLMTKSAEMVVEVSYLTWTEDGLLRQVVDLGDRA